MFIQFTHTFIDIHSLKQSSTSELGGIADSPGFPSGPKSPRCLVWPPPHHERIRISQSFEWPVSWAGCVSNSFKFNMAPSYSRSSINRLKDVKGKIMENLQETMAFPLKYIGGSGNFFPVNQSNDSSNPTCLTYYIILPIWSLTKFPSDHSADFWTKRCHRELVWFRSSSQSRSGRLESRVNLMGPSPLPWRFSHHQPSGSKYHTTSMLARGAEDRLHDYCSNLFKMFQFSCVLTQSFPGRMIKPWTRRVSSWPPSTCVTML